MTHPLSSQPTTVKRTENLADRIYRTIKEDIFQFVLLPGDRFTEQEMAERTQTSRTPVREALFRLQREGFVQVQFRNGWQVRPFDFHYFENLYDIRIILELAAVQRLCNSETVPAALEALTRIWWVDAADRLTDGEQVSQLDEAFHIALIKATGNTEMAKIHEELTDKIRIIRHLDFTQTNRITATYEEHAEILRQIVKRQQTQAQMLLKAHIEASKAEVRKITIHRLQSARKAE